MRKGETALPGEKPSEQGREPTTNPTRILKSRLPPMWLGFDSECFHHSHSSVLNNICHLSKQLQAEKGKAAARIDGLEDEIDGLKGRLRKLQDKADREVRVMKSPLVMTSWFLKSE